MSCCCCTYVCMSTSIHHVHWKSCEMASSSSVAPSTERTPEPIVIYNELGHKCPTGTGLQRFPSIQSQMMIVSSRSWKRENELRGDSAVRRGHFVNEALYLSSLSMANIWTLACSLRKLLDLKVHPYRSITLTANFCNWAFREAGTCSRSVLEKSL